MPYQQSPMDRFLGRFFQGLQVYRSFQDLEDQKKRTGMLQQQSDIARQDFEEKQRKAAELEKFASYLERDTPAQLGPGVTFQQPDPNAPQMGQDAPLAPIDAFQQGMVKPGAPATPEQKMQAAAARFGGAPALVEMLREKAASDRQDKAATNFQGAMEQFKAGAATGMKRSLSYGPSGLTMGLTDVEPKQLTTPEDKISAGLGYDWLEDPRMSPTMSEAVRLKAQSEALQQKLREVEARVGTTARIRREEQEITPLNEKATRWVHPATLQPASPDMSPKEAKDEGFVPISQNLSQAIPMARAALSTLDKYRELAKKLLVSGTTGGVKDIARIQANKISLTKRYYAGDKDVQDFYGLSSALVLHVKAFGDTANAAVPEQARQERGLPNSDDSLEGALQKLDTREQLFKKVISSSLASPAKSARGNQPADAPATPQDKKRLRFDDKGNQIP